MLQATKQVSPLRAVIYLRQSIAREESISLELQEIAGREYCKQRGYVVTAVEADPGISGRTWKRPAVVRVMAMIEAKQADVIVLWKWSRLSRSRLDWALAVDRVQVAGGLIESATEPLDTTTSTGRLARGMLTEFAAFESERIGDVWKESQQRRRRNGLPAQGASRYGYEKVDGRYAIDPIEGPILAAMYRDYIAGSGFTKIIQKLNLEGVRTRGGKFWRAPTVKGILDSGFGAALIIEGFRTKQTYWPGSHEGVITAEEWAAFQVRRSEAIPPRRLMSPKHMLSGLAVCGDCGARMRAGQRNGGPGLLCGRYLDTRVGRLVTCNRTTADAAVKAWLFDLVADIEGMTHLEEAAKSNRNVAVIDSAVLTKRLVKLDAQMVKVTLGWSLGKIPEVAYEATIKQLSSDRDALMARIQSAAKPVNDEMQVRKVAADLASMWDHLTPPELNEILADIIKHVVIVPPPGTGDRGTGYVSYEIVPKWDS